MTEQLPDDFMATASEIAHSGYASSAELAARIAAALQAERTRCANVLRSEAMIDLLDAHLEKARQEERERCARICGELRGCLRGIPEAESMLAVAAQRIREVPP